MIQAGRIGVYGASGSGKTTLARSLVAGRPRVVVLDPLAEYGGAGVHGFRTADTIAGVLAAIKAGWQRGAWRVSYVPPAGSEPEALHGLARMLRDVQARTGATHDVTLAVDELNLSFPVQALPRHLNGFAELCSRGRHHRIEIIGIAQRLAEISTRWRGNESERYIFRLGDLADFQTAARWLPDHRDALRKLRQFEYLHVASATGEVSRHVTVKPKRSRPCTRSRTSKATRPTSTPGPKRSQPGGVFARARTRPTRRGGSLGKSGG